MSICNLIALILLTLAMLNVSSPQFYWPWKLSVATRELGHFLIFPCLLLLLPESSWQTRAALLAAAALFALPAFQALDIPTLFLGNVEKEVVYRSFEYARGLSLDFYPAQDTGGHAVPLVVVVHGGGWDSGDSRVLPELNSYLANRGYHVASINYRLAPEHRWPAQFEDLGAAIAFLKGKAEELKIKADQIAVLGRSAGAQIAGVYAYSKDDPSVRAFIDYYGPTDLDFAYEVAEEMDVINSRKLIRQLHGGDPYGPKELYTTSHTPQTGRAPGAHFSTARPAGHPELVQARRAPVRPFARSRAHLRVDRAALGGARHGLVPARAGWTSFLPIHPLFFRPGLSLGRAG